jgi:uncharacterized protein
MEAKSILAACAVSLCASYFMSPKVTINAPAPGPISVVMPSANPANLNDNRLTVDGFATISVQPDCFDLNLTFSTENSRADRAVKDIQAKQSKFIEVIKALSLENKDLKVGYVSVNPVYDYSETGNPRVRAQAASLSMTATLHNFDQIGELLQLAADSGASNVSSRFRSSDLIKRKAEARDMALKAAKAKAEQTASTLGIQLGEVVAIQDTPNNNYWNTPNEYANNYRTLDAATPNTIQAEAQELSITVQVSYRLGNSNKS